MNTTPHNGRVLVVDDEEGNRYVVARFLRHAGYEVSEARTGREALELVADWEPELLLLDIQLPDISGIEVCRQIKANPATAHIPIIHVSAHFTETNHRVEGLESGADAYLISPVEPRELLAKSRALLRATKAEAALRKSEEHFRSLFTSMSEAFVLKDAVFDAVGRIVDFRFVAANPAFETQSGLRDVIGKTMREVMPTIEPRWIEAYAKVVETGKPLRFEDRVGLLGRWFHVRAYRPGGPGSGQVAILLSDITERKQAEEALHQSEARFRSVLEGSRDIIYRLNNATGRYEYISPAIKSVLGYSPEELIEQGFDAALDIIHPDDRAATKQAITELNRTGRAEMEYRCRAKNGNYRWASNHMSLTRDSEGKALYRNGTIRDVTERKRIDEELRHRSEQFEILVNRAPFGVYLIDSNFRLAQVNPVARPVFAGIPELIGRDFEEIVRTLWRPEEADPLIRVLRHTLQTGEAFYEPEFAAVRADRRETEYYDWTVERIKLPDGRYGLVVYFRDISAQVQARQAIAESEARYRTLFTSIDQGFCVVQVILDEKENPADYRFLETNPAFEKQSGMENVVGKTVREVVPAIERQWIAIYGRVALTGQPKRFVDHSEPLGRWFDVYAFRVGEPGERKVAVLFSDISEQKQAERTLAQAQEQLRQYAQTLEATVQERTAKLWETIAELEAFSYSIGHDMRAPLRAMNSFATFLLEEYRDRLDNTGVDYLRRISTAALRLDELIRDVLSYSQVSKVELALGSVDLNQLVSEVIAGYPNFHCDGARIDVRGPLLPVTGCRALLTLCISSLLGNAVKFVTAGTPAQVELWTEQHDGRVRLSVRDNGIGLNPEDFERIWRLFERCHHPGDYPGTGIGLSVVKRAVERMGGCVGVDSQPGQGSTFWFEVEKA